jgi:hypothetical protein
MNSATSNLRRQHDELVTLAGELSAIVDSTRGAESVQRVQSVLNRLAGKLEVHRAMEDDAFYPELLLHPRQDVRVLAEGFQQKFGAAYSAFLAFRERWDATQVAHDFDGFAAAARKVIAVLAERIRHENDELYEFVDQLYGRPSGRPPG